jgi:hypothetical protein
MKFCLIALPGDRPAKPGQTRPETALRTGKFIANAPTPAFLVHRPVCSDRAWNEKVADQAYDVAKNYPRKLTTP